LHQAGAAHADLVKQDYAQRQIAADVRPFIDDMAQALRDCDLVICRAGAVTVSELCAGGVPAVLVPLVVSTTSHQKDNAAWMSRHGAAIHLPQEELTPQALQALLQTLSRDRLLAMAECARALAKPHAAARVADELQRWTRP
jgi:UDP-N-acetylglucosamine--N-acetylmuramyl-(pentapeptide) pyrophosphoryl-undecaprenol N-acetylglucosamine transferase